MEQREARVTPTAGTVEGPSLPLLRRGNGGGIYADGNFCTVTLAGTLMTRNCAVEAAGQYF